MHTHWLTGTHPSGVLDLGADRFIRSARSTRSCADTDARHRHAVTVTQSCSHSETPRVDTDECSAGARCQKDECRQQSRLQLVRSAQSTRGSPPSEYSAVTAHAHAPHRHAGTGGQIRVLCGPLSSAGKLKDRSNLQCNAAVENGTCTRRATHANAHVTSAGKKRPWHLAPHTQHTLPKSPAAQYPLCHNRCGCMIVREPSMHVCLLCTGLHNTHTHTHTRTHTAHGAWRMAH
jgi:hypothetical protein